VRSIRSSRSTDGGGVIRRERGIPTRSNSRSVPLTPAPFQHELRVGWHVFRRLEQQWFAARAADVVFSSIDLWKGCISIVPDAFDGALVTKEFPIYQVIDDRLNPDFLWCLLRSRYYQRAFRAITTGHSNRRRTQAADFEELEIVFPADPRVQKGLS